MSDEKRRDCRCGRPLELGPRHGDTPPLNLSADINMEGPNTPCCSRMCELTGRMSAGNAIAVISNERLIAALNRVAAVLENKQ
jgi:hypothetical protein